MRELGPSNIHVHVCVEMFMFVYTFVSIHIVHLSVYNFPVAA